MAALLVLLSLAGAMFPGSLTWGVHFLGFLPPVVTIAYLLCAAIILWGVRTPAFAGWVERIAAPVRRRGE